MFAGVSLKNCPMAEFKRPEVEVNVYRKANPLTAKVLDHKNLADTGEDAQVYHIRFDVKGLNYREGQSIGVLPPGENEKGKPHNPRLYSIASVGSDVDKDDTLELCIKRVVYRDEANEIVRGVCSNFLADLKVGDEVQMTGPAGRLFLLPASEEINRPYIFLATGTGIAPFRGFLRRLLESEKMHDHPIHLFFGARHREDILYDEEFEEYAKKYPNFHYHKAISREMKNREGGRMYVHHLLLEVPEAWEVLQKPETLSYMCGLKGMEDGVAESVRELAEKSGVDPAAAVESFQERLLKEVY